MHRTATSPLISNASEPGPDSAERVVLSVIGILLAGFIGFIWWAPMAEAVLRFIPDDAFYYLEIARRMGRGEGSTFDGINPTNGFHPLWQLLLVPLAPVLDASRETGIRLVMTLGVLMTGGVCLMLTAASRRLAPQSAFLAPLAVFCTLTFSANYGMESALAALLFAALLERLSRWTEPAGWIQGLCLGLLSGALVLARLDSALYIIALNVAWGLHLFRRPPSPKRRSEWLAWTLCVSMQAALVVPYVLLNLLWFGHLLPVSAMIKAGRHTALSLEWIRSWMALFALLSLGGALLVIWVRRRLPADLALRTAAIGTLLAMIVSFLKANFESYSWYFTLPVVAGAMLLPVIVASFPTRIPTRLRHVPAVLLCLLMLAGTLRPRLSQDSIFVPRYRMAAWIRTFTPPNVVLAEPDAGILGFLSERPILNIDGLTNSFAFQDAIHGDTLPQWFAQAGLNGMVLKADRWPKKAADGTYHEAVTVWKGMRGDLRQVYAVLEPWEGAPRKGAFRLWRVLRVENGVP